MMLVHLQLLDDLTLQALSGCSVSLYNRLLSSYIESHVSDSMYYILVFITGVTTLHWYFVITIFMFCDPCDVY